MEPFCWGGEGPCSPEPERYRVDEKRIVKKPPLTSDVPTWNVHKHGIYCRTHAETARENLVRSAYRRAERKAS